MKEQPAFKIKEEIYSLEYKNKDNTDISTIENLIFSNFGLLQEEVDYILSRPELSLYNHHIFIFGGIPIQPVSVYLGEMFKAWRDKKFTEQCECGGTAFIYTCGGSLLSGTVGWRHSFCPSCGKFFNIKKPGSVKKYFNESREIMKGKNNIFTVKRSVKIPLLYINDKVIERHLAAEHSEEIIKHGVETLRIDEIIEIVKRRRL